MERFPFKARLRSPEPLIGTFIQVGNPSVTEFVGGLGFDFVLIDCEHSAISLESVQMMLQAIGGSRTFGLVRVPYNHPSFISRILDAGADGIVVPQIGGVRDGRAAVSAALYPPRGTRGLGPGRAMGYGAMICKASDLDFRTTVILQVETVGALNELDDILEIPGLDMVFVGPGDLSCAMGIPGRLDDPRLCETIDSIIRKCTSRGCPCGIFAPDGRMALKWIERGVKMVVVGSDLAFMGRAATKTLTEIRGDGFSVTADGRNH